MEFWEINVSKLNKWRKSNWSFSLYWKFEEFFFIPIPYVVISLSAWKGKINPNFVPVSVVKHNTFHFSSPSEILYIKIWKY